MSRSNKFHRSLLIAMLFVVTHPRKVLAGAFLALLGTSLYAYLNLGISTDQDDLFSSKVQFFKDYINFTKDFPENQANYVMIEPVDGSSPPPTNEWIAAADAITDRLRKDTSDVQLVDSHVPLEKLGNQAILFEGPKQVKQDFADFQQLSFPFRPTNLLNRTFGDTPVQRFFGSLIPRRFAPQTLTGDSTQFITLMANGMTAALKNTDAKVSLGNQVPDLRQLSASDPSKLGYYYVEDQQEKGRFLLLLRVFEKDNYTQRNGIANAIDGIRADVADAAKPFTKFKVALTGRPALEADEMATTDRDARLSEIAALTAVFIGLVLLLRSLWIAVVAEIALLIGIGWTFGWAALTVHKLNLLSMVFLIALTGIGMDYLIQVLTRYRRESARRSSPRGIWTGVFKYVSAPINTACLGAAGAFFVSIFTSFRGAAELGIVAGGGLLLCLLTGYVILPPLLTLFPAKPRPVDAERFSDCDEPKPSAASTTRSRLRHLWLAPPFVWAILLLLGIPYARRFNFDPSLLKMQAQSLQSVQLIHKLQTWSAAVLAPPADLEKLRQVRDAIEPLPSVQNTESILTAYDNEKWLKDQKAEPIPSGDYDPVKPESLPAIAASADNLAASILAAKSSLPSFKAAAGALADFSAALKAASPQIAADRLTDWQRTFVQQLRVIIEQFRPQLDLAALPESLRSHLIGVDGQFVLYINPKEDLWKQSDLRKFVLEVEAADQKIPNAPRVTGIAVNVYHSTSSIEKSFYHATGYALCLIFLLVLIDLKDIRQTLLAISVLAMGLPMLIALMGLFHIDWNFANFFGLPILIGAGHEYGVFMVHRYNEAQSDCHRKWSAWDVSDKALLLCGYVTSVSFGFFWLLGHHEGLKSLGLVMALGTASIYFATLCVLRPLLLWKLGRKAPVASASQLVPTSIN